MIHGGFWSPWMDVDVTTSQPHGPRDVMKITTSDQSDDVIIDEGDVTVSSEIGGSYELMNWSARRIGRATAKMIDEHHAVSLGIVALLVVVAFVVMQMHSLWHNRRLDGYKKIGERVP